MATEYGIECFCYTTGRIDFDRHNNEEQHECNYPCQGDEVKGHSHDHRIKACASIST